MLRKAMLVAGLWLGMQAGAWAEFSVDSFLARVKGQDVFFTVSAHNPGDVSQQGPIKIKVVSSSDGGRTWNELQSWNLENLDAGAGWSQKFTASGEGAKARGKNYEVKMMVDFPGDEKGQEHLEQDARLIFDK